MEVSGGSAFTLPLIIIRTAVVLLVGLELLGFKRFLWGNQCAAKFMFCGLKMKNHIMDSAMCKVVATIALIFGLNGCAPDHSTETLNQTAFIFSSLHDIKVSKYEIGTEFKGEKDYPKGGALAILGKSQLLW